MATEELVKDTEEKVNPFAADAEKENASRTGAGLRVFTGYTRGKGSMPIRWEQFAEDSKPKSMQEFLNLTNAGEADLLRFAIIGFNDEQYTAASDPIAEHVNKLWDDTRQMQFRNVVRNLHKAYAPLNKSIEDVVAMVKPGVEAAYQAELKTK